MGRSQIEFVPWVELDWISENTKKRKRKKTLTIVLILLMTTFIGYLCSSESLKT